MKRILALLFAIALAPTGVFPQEKWMVSIEPQKRFIENKSQFDGRNELPGSQILYGVDWGAIQIYFTTNGLTYRFDERKKNDKSEERKRERERAEKLSRGESFTRKEDEDVEVERDVVQVQWVGFNPEVQVTGFELTDDYFSYSTGKGDAVKNINYIKGYETLLYKNLYPNIDLEYAFHPIEGMKYKLVLHPGADVSQIRMQYSGTEKVIMDESGNLRIGTTFGDIIDHAPLTFYSKNQNREIISRFKISGNIVSFELEDYKSNKTVIIDPWTVTPNMPGTNKAYYIKADDNGNAYIYGGESPYRLQKINSAGAVQWTYNSPWNAAGNWFGTLAVDLTGSSFITSGTGNQISKINTAGNLEWINNAGGGPFNEREYWTMDFNCDYTKLALGGTLLQNLFPLQGYGAIYDVDLLNGTVSNPMVVAHQTSDAQIPLPVFNEVRSLCTAPTGDYFYLTIDTIGSLNQALAVRYEGPSAYRFSYYLPYGQGGTGQGTNGIRATPYFLYTTNGQVLYKRDINNGNIINSVFIPSGAAELCSGVSVDSCGNVYVGSVGLVVKYDGNLNLITSATTPGQVYDVTVTDNGDVLACGAGFALSVDLSACSPMRNICITPFPIEITSIDILCNGGCEGSATATPLAGTPPFTYLWSNGQATQTASNLCAGIYVVTVTDATNAYAIGSVVIDEPPLFTVSVTSSANNCGTVAVASPSSGMPPYSYEWSNGGTGPSISGLATGTYSVTTIDGNGCSAFGSVSAVQSPGFSISATTTDPVCSNCDGSASLAVSGGNPPYSYTWSTGDSTDTINNLCAGIYYVTASENPSGANSVFWSETFSSSSGWTLNVAGPSTNGNNPNRWVVNGTRDNTDCPACPSNGSAGNYLHVTCDSASFFCLPMGGPSCVYSAGFPFLYDNSTDKYAISPNISTIGKTGITLSFWYMCVGDMAIDYGAVSLSNDGGNSWTDLSTIYSETPTCTQAIITVPAIYENIPNFRIRFRWVNNNDLNGNSPPFVIDDIELSAADNPCTAITSIYLESDSGPVIAIDTIMNVSCKNAGDGAIQTSVSGGTPPYSYNWTNGDSVEDLSGLNGGLYILIVTDSADCVAIKDATITEPTAIAVTGIVNAAGCTSGGSIDISVSGGTPSYAYSWSSSDTLQDISNVPSGAYEVTITDFNNCTKTALFNVSSPALFLAVETNDVICGGTNDGSVTTTLLGGAPPFRYSWSNGDTTSSLTAVPGGTYSVSVSDNSGCSAEQSATVESPLELTMIASITRVLCQAGNDGGIKLIPSGGTPDYTALWSNGQTELTLTGLAPDIYSVTVTDSAGCTADSSFSLTSVSVYTVETTSTNASCDGSATGSMGVNIVSGNTPPYSYAWSTGDTIDNIASVAPGIYRVTVSDSLNCLRTDTVEVSRGLKIDEVIIPPCPSMTNGSILITVTGGNEPYNYAWNTGAATSSLSDIGEGEYSLTVSDQNDCRGSDTIIVMSDTSNVAFCDTLIFYDVFSPNGDGVNEQWVVDGLLRYPGNEIQIFNRWGNLIYEAKPYINDWEGLSKKDELLPSATYYYILKLHDIKESVYSGNITLIR